MLKLYIRPVCFQRPEEEENSLSLLVESRREKVRTIKGKENRSRSIAAGLLLRHMLLEEQIPYAAESFGLVKDSAVLDIIPGWVCRNAGGFVEEIVSLLYCQLL